MIKKLIVVLICSLFLHGHVYASNINYDYITGKLIGEGAALGEDMFIMACTVKNRLEHGWSPKRVMNPYYAKYVKPTSEDIEFVKDVIEDSDCPPVYFFYSEWLVKDKLEKPFIKSYGNWYYTYEQYKDLWK